MSRPLRFALIWACILTAFAVLAPFASAGAVTYYASPAGGGSTCSQKTPCSLTTAVAETLNEDSVSLAVGTYVLPGGGLGITKEIDIGGQLGTAASTVIDTTGGSVHVNSAAKPILHDMRIEGTGGLILSSGTAERLFVSYTGPSSAACSLTVGTVMLDSICWSHDDGGSGSDAIEAAASSATGKVVLRNVTAIAGNSDGDGIRAQVTGALSKLVIEGTDVIARGETHPDVAIELNGGGFPVAEVMLANSSFAKVEGELAPFGTVTAPGTNGNQAAAPSFVNAAAGDFREALGSPTIDGGVNDPLNGSVDLAADPRSLPACLSGRPVTDIGAYEASPVDCSSPAPKNTAPDNEFSFGKQKLNRKKGTATLIAVVPGPGSLKLAGPGLKSVSMTASASGSVKLAVKLVGKAKKGLARSGRRKISPKVTFTPTGGSPYQLAHSMTLRQKVG